MKLSLAYQKLLGSGDGIAVGNSNYPVVKPGQYYYVRPIIGPIKEGTLVKSVAKRSWMGSKRKLIKNYIIKRVDKVKDNGKLDLRGYNRAASTDILNVDPEMIIGEVVLYCNKACAFGGGCSKCCGED